MLIEYSEKNLNWLEKSKSLEKNRFLLSVGDAADFKWTEKIDAVACETYLGVPMSRPPVEIKLKEQKQECLRIILGFLRNLSGQLSSGTPLALAIPAWLKSEGGYERLNLLDLVEELGYNVVKLNHLSQEDMLYFRDGQVVAREIIVLRKK